MDAQLVLSLATVGSVAATDEQALGVLKLRCQTCHNPQNAARWNLSVLPAAEQWGEIKRRVEIAPHAPGHMPPAETLEEAERSQLLSWLEHRIMTPMEDPFSDYNVEIKETTVGSTAQKLSYNGNGRYTLPLGQKRIGDPTSFQVTVTGADQIAKTTYFEAVGVPDDGTMYRSVTVEPRDMKAPSVADGVLRAANITDESLRISWLPATDDRPAGDLTYTLYLGGQVVDGIQTEASGFFANVTGLNAAQSYDFSVVVHDRTGNKTTYQPLRVMTTGPIEAHFDLRLLTNESQPVPDTQALDILRTRCQTCHNPQNAPRWDLTILPLRDSWAEIARRINLDERTLGHMPVGSTLASEELATLNLWLAEQQNPSSQFSGYAVRAFDPATTAELAASAVDQGRTRIALGLRRPGSALTIQVVVTGADALSQTFALPLTVAAEGALGTVTVPARDKTAPIVADPRLTVSALTATSATLTFKPARDDRPAQDLIYQAFRTNRAPFDSLDEIERHGMRIGSALTEAGSMRFDAVGLEASHTYYFNVVVRDRTGNVSVYEKLQVQTLPQVFCEEIAISGSIRTWRNGLAKALEQGSISDATAAAQVNRCFPKDVPQCAQRLAAYAQRDDIAPSGSDGTLVDLPQKQPPAEIIDPVSGKYWIPDNIEQIARDKGWTSVRYKSRHAGGFDPGTPNLLMVYVPGDKVNPPVPFDRWLNFPLPIDDDEPAASVPQKPRPKFGPPRREEYELPNDFPGTFTMVSQDRATADKPSNVYFQMFRRDSGSAAFSAGGAVDLAGCVSCHPNGLRAISPLGYHVRKGEERLPDEDWKAVELINRKMIEGAGFKAALWGAGGTPGLRKPLYRAERGPTMGPTVPVNGISRTKAFILGGVINGQQIDGCYKRASSIAVRDIFGRKPGIYKDHSEFSLSETPVINADKVIAAMNCESCHANGQRWPLNQDNQSAIAQVRFKVLVDQSMPLGLHLNPFEPGNDTGEAVDQLTADERFALMNCLEAEFELEQANLEKWLTQVDCQQ